MVETREGLLAHYRAVRAELEAAIEGLSAEQMVETTIDGWSVKDHLAHLGLWDDLRADEVIRQSAGHETALKMTGEQDHAFNVLLYEVRRGLSLGQARWEAEHARQRLEDAISAAPPEALEATRYGEAGLVSRHDALHAGYIAAWRQRLGY